MSGLVEEVILHAELVDQFQLRLEKVDVLFFGLQNLVENVTAYEILVGLAVGDRCLQVRDRIKFGKKYTTASIFNPFTQGHEPKEQLPRGFPFLNRKV